MTILKRLVTDPTVVPGLPGTPDVPAQDAYVTTEYVKDPHWEAVAGAGGTVSLRYVYWRAVLTEHPATPAVPGLPGTAEQVIPQPQAGWGASAFSSESIGEARLVFRVKAPTPGVTVGITRAPRSALFTEPTGGYATAEGPLPGLYFDGNFVWLATERLAQPMGEAITSFFTEDVFTIERKAGKLRYLQNGYLMREVDDFYPASDRLWASASLYDAGSQVMDAAFKPIPPDEGMRLALRAVEINASDAPRDLYVERSLPPLRFYAGDVAPPEENTGSVTPQNYLATALPGLAMVASEEIRGDGAALRLGAVVLTAINGVSEPAAAARNGAAMLLRPVTLAARATSVSVPPPDPGDETPSVTPQLVAMPIELRTTIAHAITDPGAAALMPIALLVDIPMEAALVQPTAVMPIEVDVDVRFLISESAEATMPIALALDIPMVAVGGDIDVYAVNLATSGSTRYRHFPFTSFARIGNRYFGAGNLGVCELGGDTDAGDPIEALLDLGDKDFGTMQRKTLVEAWLTLAGKQPMVMELTAEGARYTYRTEGASLELRERRFKFGKGRALQTTFIKPILRNEGGADFQLDAVAFAVQVLSRKG